MKYKWDYNSENRTLALGKSQKQVSLLRLSNRYRCICETSNSSFFFKSDGLLSKQLKLKNSTGDLIANIRFADNFNYAEIWYNDTRYNFITDGKILSQDWTLQNGKGPIIKATRQNKSTGELESDHQDELLPTIGLYAYMHQYESRLAKISLVLVTAIIVGIGTTLLII